MIKYITNQLNLFDRVNFKEFEDWVVDKKILQVDTETEGFFDFENKVLLIQIGNYETQFVFDYQSLTKEQRNVIKEVLVNDAIKIFQNAVFDIKFLWFSGLDVKNVYDTMIAEMLIYSGRDDEKLMLELDNTLVDKIGEQKKGRYSGWYGLKRLAHTYCGATLDKSVRGDILKNGITNAVIEYAANDVKYLEIIREAQIKKLVELEMSNGNCQDIYTVLGLENNTTVVIAHMEYSGVKLDLDKWKNIKKNCDEALKEADQEIIDYVWKEPKLAKYKKIDLDLFTGNSKTTKINWSSPKQKLEVLQTLSSSIKSTSEIELTKFKNKIPFIEILLRRTKVNKLVTSFSDALPKMVNKKTGKIHTNFKQLVSTGRMAASSPNLQQIPSKSKLGKVMREAFVSEKGYKLIGTDFSSAELRVIAELSKDPLWINSYLNDEDLHSVLASKTFKIDMKDVKKPTPFKPDIDYRSVQKTINFGLALT